MSLNYLFSYVFGAKGGTQKAVSRSDVDDRFQGIESGVILDEIFKDPRMAVAHVAVERCDYIQISLYER